MDEIMIGQYRISVLLTVVLGIIYGLFDNPDGTSRIRDKWKTLIVPCAGMFLGMIGLVYSGAPWTSKTVITYLVNGFMSGAASIGLWKMLGAVNVSKVSKPPGS